MPTKPDFFAGQFKWCKWGAEYWPVQVGTSMDAPEGQLVVRYQGLPQGEDNFFFAETTSLSPLTWIAQSKIDPALNAATKEGRPGAWKAIVKFGREVGGRYAISAMEQRYLDQCLAKDAQVPKAEEEHVVASTLAQARRREEKTATKAAKMKVKEDGAGKKKKANNTTLDNKENVPPANAVVAPVVRPPTIGQKREALRVTHNPPRGGEKRLERKRGPLGKDARERLGRGCSQDYKVVSQTIKNATTRVFKISGSIGNLYDVTIGLRNHCTCIDHENGHQCKHMFFVLCKVLGVPRDSMLLGQTAFLSTELELIFDFKTPKQTRASVAIAVAAPPAPTPIHPKHDADPQVKAAVNLLVAPPTPDPKIKRGATAQRLITEATPQRQVLRRSSSMLTAQELPGTPATPQRRPPGAGLTLTGNGYLNVANLQPGTRETRDTKTYNTNSWMEDQYGGWGQHVDDEAVRYPVASVQVPPQAGEPATKRRRLEKKDY